MARRGDRRQRGAFRPWQELLLVEWNKYGGYQAFILLRYHRSRRSWRAGRRAHRGQCSDGWIGYRLARRTCAALWRARHGRHRPARIAPQHVRRGARGPDRRRDPRPLQGGRHRGAGADRLGHALRPPLRPLVLRSCRADRAGLRSDDGGRRTGAAGRQAGRGYRHRPRGLAGGGAGPRRHRPEAAPHLEARRDPEPQRLYRPPLHGAEPPGRAARHRRTRRPSV